MKAPSSDLGVGGRPTSSSLRARDSTSGVWLIVLGGIVSVSVEAGGAEELKGIVRNPDSGICPAGRLGGVRSEAVVKSANGTPSSLDREDMPVCV